MSGNPPAVGAATLERVYEAIERDSDFEGVATPTAQWLAEAVGISKGAVLWSIHRLHDRGRLSISGRQGRGGVLTLQLPT